MTTLTLITAADAVTRSESNLDTIKNNALFTIDTLIRNRSDAGWYTARFDFRSVDIGSDRQPIVTAVKDSLTADGFVVTVDRQFKAGDNTFEIINIDWEPVT